MPSRRLALFLLPALAAPAVAAPPAPLDRIVRPAAQRFMRDRCHVGLSIVVRTGGVDHFYNEGRLRRGGPKPNRATVYEIASLTKTFTGALAARALLEHRMALDTDFRAYLPGPYPGRGGYYPTLELGGAPITLRSLATHTSGMPRDVPDTDDLLADPDYDRIGDLIIARNQGYNRVRFLEAVATTQLRSRPGTTFAYSNAGIRLLGYGLSRVYGKPYSDVLRRHILKPRGMTETGFAVGADMRDRIATPYSRHGRVQPYHDDTASAAYGLYSTPRDMARYLTWQLDERRPIIRRAHTIIRRSGDEAQALIWNVGDDKGRRMLWHGGGSFGMTSQMVLYPAQGDGYVLLANDACAGTEAELKALAMRIEHKLAASAKARPGVATRRPR